MESIELARKHKINSINLTAYRAIKIFKMLIEKPCSNIEIIENLKNDAITNRSISDDTLRATLNSLKAVGCNISRPSPNNNYKYILNSHPFGIKLTENQIKILIEVRRNFLSRNDWQTVLALNDLYDKFIEISQNEEMRDILNSTKPFIKIRPKVLAHLKSCDIENKELIMDYATSVKKQCSIKVKIDKIFCYSERLYLWGWYFKRKQYSYFNVEKILSINNIKPAETFENPIFYTAKYKLYKEDCKVFKCDDEETIIDRDDQSITVEYQVKSEFKFFQRLLNFGENFELIEPLYAKKALSDKIEKIFKRYKDGND